jgi:hypothetical protein
LRLGSFAAATLARSDRLKTYGASRNIGVGVTAAGSCARTLEIR